MKLIGLGNDRWINADFIESIDESYDGRCRVWTIGGGEEPYLSDYTVEELIDIMEAALGKLDKPTRAIITEMVKDLARQLPNVSVSSALELLLVIGAMEGER